MPPYRYERRSLLKGLWDFFFDPNYVGNDNESRCVVPHVHLWEYYSTIRCGWRIENNRPAGQRLPIDTAIFDVEKHPARNETKLSQLRDWKRSGYEFVHTSQTVYKCKNCPVTKNIDVYVAPVRGDGTGPMIVDIGSKGAYQKKFTETSRIPVVNTTIIRKEVAVEPMKRYGVRIKKLPPVVPMED